MDLILALDVNNTTEAYRLADQTADSVDLFKVGLELFTREGPELVRNLRKDGHRIMLDLKLHDIPNTVAEAVRSCCDLGVELLTLHATGGPAMIEAAAEAREREGSDTKLLPVTVLTSMNQEQLIAIGIDRSPADQVLRLASMALQAGAQGLVCSPMELESLRQHHGQSPHLVTPGIRPAGSSVDDQQRIATPAAAKAWGASAIVVGRPIRKATHPNQAAQHIKDMCR